MISSAGRIAKAGDGQLYIETRRGIRKIDGQIAEALAGWQRSVYSQVKSRFVRQSMWWTVAGLLAGITIGFIIGLAAAHI